jgi:hypothetical protein
MLFVFLLILIIVLIFLYTIGVFTNIQIKTDSPIPIQNVYIAYKFYKNEYKSAGKGIGDIKQFVKHDDSFVFGIFYDDPKIVGYYVILNI